MVRAKFVVVAKVPQLYGEGEVITLMTVSSGSEENKEFFHLTPAGNIKLETVNPDAASQFELDKEYYVDFTKAESPAASAGEPELK